MKGVIPLIAGVVKVPAVISEAVATSEDRGKLLSGAETAVCSGGRLLQGFRRGHCVLEDCLGVGCRLSSIRDTNLASFELNKLWAVDESSESLVFSGDRSPSFDPEGLP